MASNNRTTALSGPVSNPAGMRTVTDAATGESLALMPSDAATQASTLAYLQSLTTPQAMETSRALARVYDEAVAALIGPNDVQKEGGREFKKKSAWRKLGRHFRISTEVMSCVTERTDDGHFLSIVTVRAAAPWGQMADALGACCTDEATGRRTISTADAIATAETRATNRAVSNLIAMGEVSAEEIGDRKPYGDGGQRNAHGVGGGGGAQGAPARSPVPPCPKCKGAMWDNREKNDERERDGKKLMPDFSCKDKDGCGEVIWRPRDSAPAGNGSAGAGASAPPAAPASHASAAGATGHGTGSATAPAAGGGRTTSAGAEIAAADRVFPQSKRFESLQGHRLGDIGTDDLAAALEYLRGKSPAWAEAITTVLADREVDGGGDYDDDGGKGEDADDLPF